MRSTMGYSIFLTWTFVSFFVCAPAPQEPSMAALEGTWLLVAVDDRGNYIDGDDAKKEDISCIIKGKELLFIQGRHRDAYSFKVRPRDNPPALDVIYPDNKSVNHAIYSLQEGRLRICVSKKWNPNTPEERPVKFTTKREENKNLHGLVVYIFERKEVKP